MAETPPLERRVLAAVETRRGVTATELARRARPHGVVGRLSPEQLTAWLVDGGLATTNGAGVLYPSAYGIQGASLT